MAACIQPGRLVELGTVKAFRDSGLLARLLYVVPRSAVGSRRRTTGIDPYIEGVWDARLTALAAAARKRGDAGDAPKVLQLDGEALDVLDAFRVELEPDLHPDHGRYAGVADWLNKLPGAVVRIAGALTLIDDPEADEVTADTVRNAVRIGRAYIDHAIAAFGLTRPNGETFAQARQVLATAVRLCREAKAGSIAKREVHQKLRDRAWVETVESLDTPLDLLVEYGHVRIVNPGPKRAGRPSWHIAVHPDCLRDDLQ
jgi:hypothetical protein